MNQRRRHHDVVAGDVEIELLHQRDRLEVLRGDQRDRDVVDVQLVLLDEMQEQIQRPFEVGELDRKRVGRGLELCGVLHRVPVDHGHR